MADHIAFNPLARTVLGENQVLVASERTDGDVSFAKAGVLLMSGKEKLMYERNSLIFSPEQLKGVVLVFVQALLKTHPKNVSIEEYRMYRELVDKLSVEKSA